MSQKPLPEPLYGCAICSEDYSWPADDLFWSESLQDWCCNQCWDDVESHWQADGEIKNGISLAEELKRRGLSR